jgi:hypothetical protein
MENRKFIKYLSNIILSNYFQSKIISPIFVVVKIKLD